jgi:hypothetical protein
LAVAIRKQEAVVRMLSDQVQRAQTIEDSASLGEQLNTELARLHSLNEPPRTALEGESPSSAVRLIEDELTV